MLKPTDDMQQVSAVTAPLLHQDGRRDVRREFGAYLRREREQRKITLAEVAEATKIPLVRLEQIEAGDWSALPAEVFVRGFVRSYARHVGISEEDANLRYRDALAALQRQRNAHTIPVGEAAVEIGSRRRFGLALFVIILLIIATITLSLLWRRGHAEEPQASLAPSTPVDSAELASARQTAPLG